MDRHLLLVVYSDLRLVGFTFGTQQLVVARTALIVVRSVLDHGRQTLRDESFGDIPASYKWDTCPVIFALSDSLSTDGNGGAHFLGITVSRFLDVVDDDVHFFTDQLFAQIFSRFKHPRDIVEWTESFRSRCCFTIFVGDAVENLPQLKKSTYQSVPSWRKYFTLHLKVHGRITHSKNSLNGCTKCYIKRNLSGETFLVHWLRKISFSPFNKRARGMHVPAAALRTLNGTVCDVK